MAPRGHYEQAEAHGISQWQRSDLSDRERAELAIQLVLTYTEHALASPPEARDSLWQKADGVCRAFLERWPANPRRPLVEVQRALASLARGEQLREEAAGTANATAMAKAADSLRSAVRQLDRVAQTAEAQSLEGQRDFAAEKSHDPLSADELQSLSDHIALHLARAQRQLGLCYPPGSADHDNAMLQAIERLQPLAERRKADGLAWEARIEFAACQRELGRASEGRKAYHQWERESPPPDVKLRLLAQLIQLHLADGKINEAMEVSRHAGLGGTENKTARAELALAKLEAAVADWKRSQRSGRQLDSAELAARVELIGREYGPRWQRKAKLLVGSAVAAAGNPSKTSGDAKSMLLAAETLYHRGQIDEALQKYDQVVRSLDDQNGDKAFEIAMTAAAIEREAGRIASAAERYHQCAARQPNHPRAAEAHRLAILCVADALRESPPDDRPAIAVPYEQLLHDHLDRWPRDASASEVRLWLGRLYASRGQWEEARASLTPIEPSSESFAPAMRLAVECYAGQLQQVAEAPGDGNAARRASLLAAATHELQPLITGPENRWPEQWTGLQRDVAVALSRMHLGYTDGPSPYAERLVTAALRGTTVETSDESKAWRPAAQSMLIIALARNGKAGEALALVEHIPAATSQQLSEAMRELYQAARQSSGETEEQRRLLGELMLHLIGVLDSRPNGREPHVIAEINRYRAWALAAAGDRAAALTHYAEFVKTSPRDHETRQQYAELLSNSDTPAELREAIAQWHVVEEHSRPGEPLWRRARHARIDLLNRLGDHEDAEKLLRLTSLLYPDWNVNDRSATP